MRYLLFGDSISWGMNDFRKRGWAGRLKSHVHKNEKIRILNKLTNQDDFKFFKYIITHIHVRRKNKFFKNYSIPGNTSKDVLRKIQKVKKKYLKNHPKKELTIIISIGTNDSRINKSTLKNNISLKEYKKNIVQIIQISKMLASRIIVFGVLPVYEKKTMPYLRMSFYSNRNIKKYNLFLKNYCKKNKIFFKDFYSLWIKKDLETLFSDGLHPNKKGHEIIFNEIKSIFY